MAEFTDKPSAAADCAKLEEKSGVVDEAKLRRGHRRKVNLLRWGVCALLFASWELAIDLGWMSSFYWSCPSVIIKTAWIQATQGTLLDDIVYTSGATLFGFVLGTVFGSLLGLSFWWSKTYAEVSEPYLIVLNALPKLALAPVLVILFGIGFTFKVILAFLMTVVVSSLSAFSGVRSVDPAMETLMYSLGASRMQVFTKVIIPWSMPWIISSLRLNIALALAGAIVGEFIVSNKGVGRMIIYAGITYDIKLVWVGVAVLSLLAILMYWGVVALEKWLSKRLMILPRS
jgi:NitT/TauT family transport system permease protein